MLISYILGVHLSNIYIGITNIPTSLSSTKTAEFIHITAREESKHYKGREKNYNISSKSIGLALDGLKQFFLKNMVGGIEGYGHALAARGGNRK